MAGPAIVLLAVAAALSAYARSPEARAWAFAPEVLPAAGVDGTTQDAALDWTQAIAAAVARHPRVVGASASLRRQSGMADAARAGYRPRVQAGITSGEQGEYGFGQVATLGATQMLYDFGKVASGVSREEAGLQRRRAALLEQVDSVIERTAQALIEVHRFQELSRITREQTGELQRIREITELRARAGVATAIDPIQASARVEAAAAQALAFHAQLKQWQARLQAYVGPDMAAAVVAIPVDLIAVDPMRGPVPDLRVLPAIRVAQAQQDEAMADLEGARAAAYPTLSLDVSMNKRLGAAGDRYEQIYGKRMYTSAQVALNAPIYQGGELSARRRAAASALDEANAQRDAAMLEAEDRLATSAEQVVGLERRIEALARRVDDIARTRSLYLDQYLVLGTRTALDLLNAEQEIAQSRLELANARHDLWIAQVDYLLATGQARDRLGVMVPVEPGVGGIR